MNDLIFDEILNNFKTQRKYEQNIASSRQINTSH